MNWTEEQRQAIETTGLSLLVSAGAGAGKTAVLVQRLIARLTDRRRPTEVDRMLVVTFTEAAAREVQARVREALHLAVGDRPDLRRQLALVDRAWISTLHSFCLRLVRKYFYLLDLDPAFRVAGEEEALLLRLDAVDDLFEECYERGDPGFLELVDVASGPGGDRRLKQMVLDLHAFAVSQVDAVGWLRQAAAAFAVAEGAAISTLPWGPALAEGVRLGLERVAGLLAAAIRLARRPGGPSAWLDTLEREVAVVSRAAGAGEWEAIAAAMEGFAFDRLPPHRGGDEMLKEQAKALRDEAKAQWRRVDETCRGRSPAAMVAEVGALAPRMACLTGLVEAFDACYLAAKTSRLLVDFSDLERYCLRLVERPGVAAELQQGFDEVLVDEYQDINPLQDAILQRVSRGDGDPSPNLFLVGDVKQSIYRFRLAEPGLFLSRYHSYPDRPRCRRISLAVNFRSRPPVLHGVNYLFRQLLTPGVGELAYDPEAELVPHLPGPEGEVEVHLLDRGETGSEDSEEDLLETVEREAQVIAHRIRAMLEEPGFLLGDPPRPPRYRDFAVLLRATRGQANLVLETLRLAGIPAGGELATGYFQAAEVQVMLSLLRLIDNPRQDIPLAAVLRSPVVGLTPEDLARIRLAAGGEFWDAVQAAGDPRVGRFRERLDAWRTLARRGPLADLITAIYHETGYPEYVGAMPAGAQRQANLLALHDRARAFDHYAARGLVSFLRLLDGLAEADEDLGAARALGQGEDGVRVMSVHRSKGLEFPVVFLAGLGRRFNLGAGTHDLLYHRQLGLGPAFVDRENDVVYPSLAERALAGRLRLEGLAEELRILYVAMTRARERLCLVGSARGLEAALTRWAAVVAGHPGWPLPDALLAGVTNPLEWIGLALARHPRLELGCPPADRLPATEPSRFKLVRWGRPPAGRAGRVAPAGDPLPEPDPELAELFQQSLTWSYGRPELAGKAAKVTVTELKGRDWTAEPGMREGRGAEAGTAAHLVLRHLRLDGDLDAAAIAAAIQTMVEEERLDAAQAELVDAAAVSRFFAGPLGSRLRSDPARVRRELPFTLALPAEEVYPDLPAEQAAGERVLVQGVIDCLLETDEGLVLVDFKTDRAGEGDIAAMRERHSPQLRLYARAAAAIYRRPVVGAYLHFLASGITAEVDLG